MSFFPAPHPPFSRERHPPKIPPALVIPKSRYFLTDSPPLTPSLKVSSPTFPSIARSRASTTNSRASLYPSLYSLEIISLNPSFNLTSSYLSLILKLKNSPSTIQNAIFLYQEPTTLWCSPFSTSENTPVNSSIQSNTDSLICTMAQHEKLTKIISKTPQAIFLNANFGNPWYVLEIQEINYGDPHFTLAATYPYQLLLSTLKHPSQLCLRKPDGRDNHNLYERFSLTYEVEKLGKLSRVGYLGEDGAVDKMKRVFIKMLDLGAEPEGKSKTADRKIALNLMEQVGCIYHEINLLCSIPLHPHITFPPIGYVTLGSEEGRGRDGRKIVGFVGEYYKNGRLSDYLFLPGEFCKPRALRPIILLQKAKWALQITSAIMHLHRKAGISMGDGGRGFGLERFLVDEFLQLHFTGFGNGEKVSRLSWRVPPEARIRGEWDVNVEKVSEREIYGVKKLIWKRNNYTRLRWEQDNLRKLMSVVGVAPKYPFTLIPSTSVTTVKNNSDKGNSNKSHESYYRKRDNITLAIQGLSDSMESGNSVNGDRKISYREKENGGDQVVQKERMARANNNWSAFEEWRHIPRALEIVETYSLGVMLWLLFEQIPSETLSTREGEIPITWTEDCQIPREWRALVEACVRINPGDRIDLEKVLRVFVSEVGNRWDGGWFMG